MSPEAPEIEGIDYGEIVQGLLDHDQEAVKVMLIGYSVEDIRKIAENASQTKAAMAGLGDHAVVEPEQYTVVINACQELLREKD